MSLLGILGGMGPLASAEFLDTFYRLNLREPEQDAPACVLYSDPSIPDRTTAILAGDTRELLAAFVAALDKLAALGAERIVVACVTAHHLLPELPAELRRRVVSLLGLAFQEIAAQPRPLLLLSTSGTRKARIFESHEGWEAVAPWIRLLDPDDQERVHRLTYRLKADLPAREALAEIEPLLPRYGAQGFLFGCTELHLLSRAIYRETGAFDPRIVDPLVLAARDFATIAAGQSG